MAQWSLLKREISKQFIQFCLIGLETTNLFSLGFTLIALKFLVETINISPLISMALLVPITTLMNFFGIKLFVFQNKRW